MTPTLFPLSPPDYLTPMRRWLPECRRKLNLDDTLPLNLNRRSTHD